MEQRLLIYWLLTQSLCTWWRAPDVVKPTLSAEEEDPRIQKQYKNIQ